LEGKLIDIDQKKERELKAELMVWRTKVSARVQSCSFLFFLNSLFSFTLVVQIL
jgi:hypothetical protein